MLYEIVRRYSSSVYSFKKSLNLPTIPEILFCSSSHCRFGPIFTRNPILNSEMIISVSPCFFFGFLLKLCINRDDFSPAIDEIYCVILCRTFFLIWRLHVRGKKGSEIRIRDGSFRGNGPSGFLYFG